MYSNWKKLEDKNNKQIIKTLFVKVLSLNQGKKVEVEVTVAYSKRYSFIRMDDIFIHFYNYAGHYSTSNRVCK